MFRGFAIRAQNHWKFTYTKIFNFWGPMGVNNHYCKKNEVITHLKDLKSRIICVFRLDLKLLCRLS